MNRSKRSTLAGLYDVLDWMRLLWSMLIAIQSIPKDSIHNIQETNSLSCYRPILRCIHCTTEIISYHVRCSDGHCLYRLCFTLGTDVSLGCNGHRWFGTSRLARGLMILALAPRPAWHEITIGSKSQIGNISWTSNDDYCFTYCFILSGRRYCSAGLR